MSLSWLNKKNLKLNALVGNTLLGRFVLAAAILITSMVIVAWVSQQRVSEASQTNTLNLSERVQIAHYVRDLTNLLWEVETSFQQYMLSPNEKHQTNVISALDKAIAGVQQLQTQNWPGKLSGKAVSVADLLSDTTILKQQLVNIMELRSDPLQVFTAMPIMANTMNPLNNQFLSMASLALNEADDSQEPSQQNTIKELFGDLRYLWSQRINTFRILASSRVGMFKASVLVNIKTANYDIEIIDQKMAADLHKLEQIDTQGKLGFQQSEALHELIDIRKKWNVAYEKVVAIMLDGEKWRRDTQLLRNTIHPLFSRVWDRIRLLEAELEKRANADIYSMTYVADEISNSVWLLTAVISVIVILAALVFELQIRRPITKVSRALKAEAAGENITELPPTSLVETSDLITAFANMREQVHNRQDHLQAVLTYAVEGIITTNLSGKIESINPAAELLFDCAGINVIGMQITEFVPGIDNHLMNGSHRKIELTAITATGNRIPIGLSSSTMRVSERELHLIIMSDISERQTMLNSITVREQRLRSILDNTAEAIVTFDENYRVETWNTAAMQLFGWTEREVTGQDFTQYITLHVTTKKRTKDNHFLQQFVGVETEVIGHHKDSIEFPVSLKLSRMTIDNKVKYTALIANISERKALMENLRRLAEHDSLTGLFNRAYFHAELERTVELINANKSLSLAMLYIDLDNFKYVNDTLGHAAGDKLLIEVSQLLNDRTRRSDLVARLGGDEFVILINDAKNGMVQAIAESFRHTLSDYAFHYEGKTVDIGCSIGVAMLDNKCKSPGEILSQADLACHLAKRAGRNRVHIFTAKDDGNVRTMSIDMGWSRRIKQAIEYDKYALALQPIVECTTGRVKEFEILIRMLDEDGSIIMPNGFLPTAERFGLSSDIDAWVIRNALTYLARFREQGAEVRFAINLSGQSITSKTIMQLIPKLLDESKLDPSALTFEVTETVAIGDMHEAVQLLTQLQNLGCITSLDDFGSGMSSFAYLRELPVNIVKIDGRFVKNIAKSTVDQAMVKAMNDIAHALGKKTVAEFVEDEESFTLLSSFGVDYCQGYYLGCPTIIDLNPPTLQKTLATLQTSRPILHTTTLPGLKGKSG